MKKNLTLMNNQCASGTFQNSNLYSCEVIFNIKYFSNNGSENTEERFLANFH